MELSHHHPPQLWVHITEVSDRKETEQLYADLLTAGGADGDLDAHLEGKRRFAGRAGREKPFPLEHFAGADSWNTKAMPCFSKLWLLRNAAGMPEDMWGELRTGGLKLLKGAQ